MINKYLYIKVSIISAILLSIILWGLLYFFPTNRYIYNSNKKIKELKRIVAKYKRDKSKFHRTNIFEIKLMENMIKRFNDKFYIVNNKENMIHFYRKIYDHIQYYEKQKGDKIIDLQITTETGNDISRGQYRNTTDIKKNKSNGLLSQLIPKLEEKLIKLSFNGELKDVLNFINHITWGDLFISIKGLEVSTNFKLTIKVYYINDRTKNNE